MTFGNMLTLITGASSGIGLEMAKLFASDGSDLVLVARRKDRLVELAQTLEALYRVKVLALPADLSDSTAPDQIFDTLRGSPVDVVVNNAGFGARGTVERLDLALQLEMIQVNVAALTHLTRLLLPGMIQRQTGGVLNVASTAAFQPGPHMAVYYATKAFVLSFTEGLAEELKATKVRVTCLAPGPTDTHFAALAGLKSSVLFRSGVMDPSTVAREGYQAFREAKVLVVPGFQNKLGALAVRFMPRPVVRKIVQAVQSRSPSEDALPAT